MFALQRRPVIAESQTQETMFSKFWTLFVATLFWRYVAANLDTQQSHELVTSQLFLRLGPTHRQGPAKQPGCPDQRQCPQEGVWSHVMTLWY